MRRKRPLFFYCQKVPEGKLQCCRMTNEYIQFINHSSMVFGHIGQIGYIGQPTGCYQFYAPNTSSRQCSRKGSNQCVQFLNHSILCLDTLSCFCKSVFAKCTAIHLVNRFEEIVGTTLLFCGIHEQINRVTFIQGNKILIS